MSLAPSPKDSLVPSPKDSLALSPKGSLALSPRTKSAPRLILHWPESARQWPKMRGLKSKLHKAIPHILALPPLWPGKKWPKQTEISLVLGNAKIVQALNKTYRGKDKPTNVLSFPFWQKSQKTLINKGQKSFYAGDVVLAYEVVLQEHMQEQKTLLAHSVHLLLHGILHLLGYDHKTERQARLMQRHEIALLAGLGFANPYVSEK